MNSVSHFINIYRYSTVKAFQYFYQNSDDEENYTGGYVSINAHIVKKLRENIKDIIITDVSNEEGIVMFRCSSRTGWISEMRDKEGRQMWIVNLFPIISQSS
jgi:hypothetical protein